jgi:hypothetical protein
MVVLFQLADDILLQFKKLLMRMERYGNSQSIFKHRQEVPLTEEQQKFGT